MNAPNGATQPPSRTAIGGLGLLAFFVIGSYELARPAAESLFLETHGSETLPWVWLAVAITAAAVVAGYNRLGRQRHLLHTFSIVSALCLGLVAVLLSLTRAETPGAAFALYVFKDVYIVVLIEIFWSFANVVFDRGSARWIYGLFCAMGSAGGATMNLVSGHLAETWTGTAFAEQLAGRSGETAGTIAVLWLLVPLFGALAVATRLASRSTSLGSVPPPPDESTDKGEQTAQHGLRTVTASPYLLTMLGLIACTQLSITLIDFQFNQGVETYEPNTDRRTALIGQVYFAINVGAAVLQLGTGLVLRLLGIARVLPGIPAALGLTLLAFAVAPQVGLLAAAKALSKILDYSLFRAAKEMLYIPLTYTQKTEGKAFIDMLTYRVAKGVASLLLLGLGALELAKGRVGALSPVTVATLGLIVVWVVLSLRLVAGYRRRTTQS